MRFISISPVHGVGDAPYSLSTHSLSLRDTALLSTSTYFVHACPLEELVLLAYVTMPWQFVNVDASHILRRSLHPTRLSRFHFQRDVIPDLPEGWKAIGCYTLVIAQPLQES